MKDEQYEIWVDQQIEERKDKLYGAETETLDDLMWGRYSD